MFERVKGMFNRLNVKSNPLDETSNDLDDERVGDPTTPATPCIHMEVIFKCHVQEGDSKPSNCALSTCPARAQAHMREQAKERENGH